MRPCPGDPDQPLAAEHRDRSRLVDQSARILLDLAGIKTNDRKRIVEREPGFRRDPASALRNKAAIGAIDQNDALGGAGLRDPAVDFMGFPLRHASLLAQVRYARNERLKLSILIGTVLLPAVSSGPLSSGSLSANGSRLNRSNLESL